MIVPSFFRSTKNNSRLKLKVMALKKSITLVEIKSILQDQKPYLYKQYGVKELSIFGSYVRDEQDHDSDLDILIDLGETPKIDLLDLVNLEYYLSDLLNIKVDVTIKGNLKKRIGQRILNEAVAV